MAQNPPNTMSAGGAGVLSQHGITIRARNIAVGTIKSWAPAARTRTATHLFEINAQTSGEPIDIALGNTAGYTVTVGKYEISTTPFEQAFGNLDLVNLSNHKLPFDVFELWANPDGSANRTYHYSNCWFTSLGVAGFDATSADRVIMMNATMAYLQRVRVV